MNMRVVLAGLVVVATATTVIQEPLYGIASGVSYTIHLDVGTAPTTRSPTTYQLLLDTGSSNTALATTTCCRNSVDLANMALFNCAASTTCHAIAPGANISVTYVSSSWTGHIVQDSVSTAALGTISQYPFVVIDAQTQFFRGGFSGIMGIAFDALAQPSNNPLPTFFQTLVNRNVVDNVFGLLLCGILQPFAQGIVPGAVAGALILGGVTPTVGPALYRGAMLYTPLIQAKWYVVLITDVAFNGTSLNSDCIDLNTPRSIVDSGTTNIVLPSAIYVELMAAIKAATLQAIPTFAATYFSDSSICCESYCNPTNPKSPLLRLPPISFSFALENDAKQQITIQIPPTYYWRPVAIHSAIGTSTCRVMGISEGTNMILGNVFMDGLYVVHDRDANRVGFGVADNCPNQAVSSKTVSTSAIDSSWCKCLSSTEVSSNLVTSYLPGQKTCFVWYWWTYVILVALVIIALSGAFLIYTWIVKRRKDQRRDPNAIPTLQEQLLVEGPMTPKEPPPPSECSSHDEFRAASPAESTRFARHPGDCNL
ncbi:Aste57867_14347 [Aphanomyces stellatus]|uniref:Aste57867_14347 protein n=1 Tax=Aphanomyces stellatus TaxID=120398 RepID=A0A485L243_9STRA|nr:hypothetical protein As57867_014293 [Aphanomyces stellatus]VFT91171.1 Aste57867_14347 [Aphanomyces stellatus]